MTRKNVDAVGNKLLQSLCGFSWFASFWGNLIPERQSALRRDLGRAAVEMIPPLDCTETFSELRQSEIDNLLNEHG